MLEKELTDQIIKAFFNVYNTLGYGFLEKVYQKAFLKELMEIGINCIAQCPIEVFYKGALVGFYYADIIVEGKVIVELKAASELAEEHEFQLVNYLKATNIEVGLLLNFGEAPQIRRKIFTNNFKGLVRIKNSLTDLSDYGEYVI